MYRRFIRMLLVLALAAIVPAAIAMTVAAIGGIDDPKHLGGTVALGFEALVLAALVPFAPRRPKLVLAVGGGTGITIAMIAAVQQSGLGWTPMALTVAIVALFGAAVWSGAGLVDRDRDDTRSYF